MSGLIAKIAVSKAIYAIDKPYSYHVPRDMEHKIATGMRVLVPFGAGNRGSEGIVLALSKDRGDTPLKMILALLDDSPVLDEMGIKLVLWLRERYFCTVYDSVKAMLPAGLYFALKNCVKLCDGIDKEYSFTLVEDSNPATELLNLLFLWDRQGDMEEIRLAFGSRDPNPAIKILVDRNIAVVETSTQRGVGDKTEKTATLAIPTEEAMAKVAPRRKTAPLRYAVTELLCAIGEASTKELCYFTGASMPTLKSLEKSGIISIQKQEVFRSPHPEEIAPAVPLVLTEEQEIAFCGIHALCQSGQSSAALLYGVTGSGKTNVYIRLIQEALYSGKTAMVLVPEIVLTPQLLRIFISYFGTSIAILHSALRAGERYDEWKRIKQGEAKVVIGTRSAVFAPLKNIGIIILDEEQETSYQSENTPRYHAREVAKYRCVQHNAVLLLCSATPSIETMYHAKSGTYHFFTLKTRYNGQTLPTVLIQDMKEEIRRGNGTVLSSGLCHEIEENLISGQQTILFLNRRGTNRMVSCGECGEVPECHRCSVKLTYHSANGRLMCHYCGHSQPLSQLCPHCDGTMNFIGMGTQKVEEELRERFPSIDILRMDTDTISATQSHEQLLSKFKNKKIPILIGTQMVAKGLDFDNVTLVGVMDADLSLYVDDIRGAERTFSLITQVVGRSGRGQQLGRAVVQTYTPENDVIQLAARQDYDGFYESEILLRRLRKSPPFQDILVLHGSGQNEAGVLRAMSRLKGALDSNLGKMSRPDTVLGPAPAAVAKVNGRYRYRLTITGKNDKALRTLVAQLLCVAQQDKENRGIAVYAAHDPL